MDIQNPTEVAFLGFAERAQLIQEGTTPFIKWNVLGLKHTLLSFICPFSLAGLKWAIAFRFGAERELTIKIRAEDGEEVGSVSLGLLASPEALTPPAPNSTQFVPGEHIVRSMFVDPTAWTVLLFDVNVELPMFIMRPGRYRVLKAQSDGSEIQIGSINAVLLEAFPLDADRIAAIRSDPQAAKAVRIEVSCRKCGSKVRAFAALDKKPELDGFVWYGDIPDTFDCGCGSTHIDLRPIKYNLHGLLGHPMPGVSSSITISPLYEKSALLEVRRVFLELLDTNPPEEGLQKYIQENPVLLHQFPAERLFFKPAILTFFKADFAILTPQKELILIEIENTKTRLMGKSGDAAQPLSHAIDQVRNWLHVADEHRHAVLASLKLDLVSSVRGVVIAGRDKGYDREHLRRLKGFDRGRVAFLTFDDVAASLGGLAEHFRTI